MTANDRHAGSLARSSEFAAGEPGGDDALAGVLAAVRLTGAQFFVVDATSPWCVDIPPADRYARIIQPEAQQIVSYHVIVEGQGWASVPGEPPVRFAAGDVILFPHGDPYMMRSGPDAPPELTPEETLQFFSDLAAGALPFVVTEGGGAPPRAQFICGFLGCDRRPFNPILTGLPRMLVLRRPDRPGDMLGRLIDLTLEEAQASRAGGRSVSLRLSELMFVELLRRHAASGATPPGCLAGFRDARITRALEALHRQPQRDWTVAALAKAAGLSRSGFAARFAALVGHPPMRYLTLWRMQLAAGLLAEGAAVADAAARVGYASEAAFSRAFKKCAGASPDAWRKSAGAS